MSRCVAALFFASLGFGQTSGKATLSGKISDAATHQPIAGAQILYRSLGRKSATTSDANGAYSIRVAAWQTEANGPRLRSVNQNSSAGERAATYYDTLCNSTVSSVCKPGSHSVPLDAPQLNSLIYLLDRLDNQIRVELDLIGQRMTALCISQSFVFSAFATAANGPRGNIQGTLIFWLPLLGITIATILEASIGAAIYAIWDRKRDREIVRQKVKHEFLLGGLNSSYFEHTRLRALRDAGSCFTE